MTSKISATDQLYKADSGKVRPALLMEGVPRALLLVSAVLTYGAKKYEDHSWRRVSADRYKDAKYRHILDDLAELGNTDDESGLLHSAHELTNSLFILQDQLDKLDADKFRALLVFNDPPQDHKVPMVDTWEGIMAGTRVVCVGTDRGPCPVELEIGKHYNVAEIMHCNMGSNFVRFRIAGIPNVTYYPERFEIAR